MVAPETKRWSATVQKTKVTAEPARAGRMREDEVSQPTRQKMFLGAQVVRESRDLLPAATGVAVASWPAVRRGKGRGGSDAVDPGKRGWPEGIAPSARMS